MKGSVTISLDDYKSLESNKEEVEQFKSKLVTAAKELEVFLSFLISRDNISEYVEEFNRQSTKSEIVITDGRAKIKFKDSDIKNTGRHDI